MGGDGGKEGVIGKRGTQSSNREAFFKTRRSLSLLNEGLVPQIKTKPGRSYGISRIDCIAPI